MSTLMRLTLVFQQGGKNMTCGMDFRKGAAIDITASDLTDAAQAAYDSFNAAAGLKTQYQAALTLERAEAYAYDLDPITPPNPPYHRVPTLGPYMSSGAAIPGTDAADGGQCPPNVALVWTFYTPLIARRGRGRVYTPPPPEEAVDSAGEVDATWLAATATRLLDIVTDVEASIAPDILNHEVVSLTYGETNAVTTYKLRDRIDTQRRRLIRGIDT